MKVLAHEPPATRGDRPGTALAHDEPNARLVRFHLVPGQEVPPHTNPSTVIAVVVAGSGTFAGEDGEAHLRPGDVAVYRPGERHSMRAGNEPLHFVAILAPGPS